VSCCWLVVIFSTFAITDNAAVDTIAYVLVLYTHTHTTHFFGLLMIGISETVGMCIAFSYNRCCLAVF
jgi:hypothetical protein